MQTLYFAHANGFPTSTYSYFFKQLHPFLVYGLPVLGQSTPIPLKGWRDLLPEIYADIEKNCEPPVIGLGHSLGGVLMFWAAQERPELFERVIALDPVLFSPFKRAAIAGTTFLGLADYFNPVAKKAKARRQHFPDRQTALDYWKGRSLFRPFHPQCFADYVEYGLKPGPNGELTLVFPAEREYQIFLHAPRSLGPGKLACSSHIIYSDSGQVLSRSDIRYLQGYFKETEFIPFEGGHMFPLEKPAEAAQLILGTILQEAS